jgi:hypothetical protein
MQKKSNRATANAKPRQVQSWKAALAQVAGELNALAHLARSLREHVACPHRSLIRKTCDDLARSLEESSALICDRINAQRTTEPQDSSCSTTEGASATSDPASALKIMLRNTHDAWRSLHFLRKTAALPSTQAELLERVDAALLEQTSLVARAADVAARRPDGADAGHASASS